MSVFYFFGQIMGINYQNPKFRKPEKSDPKFSGYPNGQTYRRGTLPLPLLFTPSLPLSPCLLRCDYFYFFIYVFPFFAFIIFCLFSRPNDST